MQTQQKTLWILFALSAILTGLYPIAYSNFHFRNSGLLSSKPLELLANNAYLTTFYIHIGLGGMALLTGWPQFIKTCLNRYPTFHRGLGYVYVSSVFVSSITGFIIALSATGGAVSATGFGLLAVLWFISIVVAFVNIKKRNIKEHQKWMIRNYSLTFAAVTLRIYLPMIMIIVGDNIELTLQIVSWLCWVPNILVIEIYVQYYYGGVLRSLFPKNIKTRLIDDSLSK